MSFTVNGHMLETRYFFTGNIVQEIREANVKIKDLFLSVEDQKLAYPNLSSMVAKFTLFPRLRACMGPENGVVTNSISSV